MENNNDKEFNAGERLYIGKTVAYEPGVKEHFERYNFAIKQLKPDFVVLDAACGTGYGSEILARSVKKVVGLEISDHALDWGRKHHQRENVELRKADLNKKLDFPDNYFDAIVSFETLEHVANQDSMLSEFKRILKSGGLLIISSPDREIITEKGGANNEFHINELSKKEFIGIINKYFTATNIYGQAKYIPLPLYKKIIKSMAKIDFLGIRRIILKKAGLQFVVHEHFSPMMTSPIEQIDFRPDNNYYVLLIKAVNNK